MVSIVTKKIKGKEYLYLVESQRDGARVIQKTVKYIGRKRPILKEEFECMRISAEDKDWILNEFCDTLSYQDHQKMKKASNNYKKHISSLDKTSKEKEKERFLSIFISNSNAIEGSTMSADETFNYLFEDTAPKGHTKKELFMASNMLDAWNYLESRFKNFPREDDLFELHRRVNHDIESMSTLGRYKKVQNYIGNIHTSSYLFVEDKIKRLFRWIQQAFEKIDDFELAFQSHAQFEIIHPFVDGNGRVGRLLLNWLLMNKGLAPIAIHSSRRADYLSALENSRRGKVEAISKFCFDEYISGYEFM